jgi:hypothetical protein
MMGDTCVNKDLLYVSSDGISFFAPAEEGWTAEDALARIVSMDTEWVYSVVLEFPIRTPSIGQRALLINSVIEEISRSGFKCISDKELVYGTCDEH